MSQNAEESYTFSDFHLNVPERILQRGGQPVALSDKAFETLCVLVREAGHLVTKRTLMAQVWPDTFVEENNLDKSVSAIRQALGEKTGQEKFIETVRGHGFRFVAKVTRIESAEVKEPAAALNELASANGVSVAQTPMVRPRTSWKTVIAIIAFAVIAILITRRWLPRASAPAPAPEVKIRSLAVLPLKNLSRDPVQEYFAEGMTEELITKLARIRSLRVISRTSVMGYRETNKSIRQIAEELNVDGILEGSVLQDGNEVRITVQLIHAATDDHVWAESYRRDLGQVLSIQGEIASAIAREVHQSLEPEQLSTETGRQVNAEAYQAYLRGLYYSEREINAENLHLAAQMFRRAVELDPEFASAFARLSRAEAFLHFTFDPNPERLVISKWALDRAFQLQPGFAEGHLAMACFRYWGFRDYDGALQSLTLAEEGLPNDIWVLRLRATICRRQGKWNEALAAQQDLLSMNPRDGQTIFELAFTYLIVREYAEAIRYFDRCISVSPDELNGYLGKALTYVRSKGDLSAAQKVLDQLPPKKHPGILTERFWMEFMDRQYEEALKISSDPETDKYRRHYFAGITYLQLRKYDEARAAFDAARDVIETGLRQNPDDESLRSLLGLSLAGLGRKEDAIREGKRAVELLPVSRDAMWGPARVQALAVIYTMLGEQESAIDLLEYLLSIPSELTVPVLRINPVFDPLRNHPRFQKLIVR